MHQFDIICRFRYALPRVDPGKPELTDTRMQYRTTSVPCDLAQIILIPLPSKILGFDWIARPVDHVRSLCLSLTPFFFIALASKILGSGWIARPVGPL